MRWLLMPFQRTFEISGRSSKKEFFPFFWVFWFIIPVTFAVVYPATQGFDTATASASSDWIGLGAAFYLLALLIPTIPLLIRRFHDFNWSGLWLLLVLVPVAGLMATIVFVWLPGNAGTNRYGPEPPGSRA